MSTSNKKPDPQVVREKHPRPTAITVIIPPGIKSAVDALMRIQLGRGTVVDLAEIALTIHNGETKFVRGWFLDAVTEATKQLQLDVQDAARQDRRVKVAALRARQEDLFMRLHKRLMRDLPHRSEDTS